MYLEDVLHVSYWKLKLFLLHRVLLFEMSLILTLCFGLASGAFQIVSGGLLNFSYTCLKNCLLLILQNIPECAIELNFLSPSLSNQILLVDLVYLEKNCI